MTWKDQVIVTYFLPRLHAERPAPNIKRHIARQLPRHPDRQVAGVHMGGVGHPGAAHSAPSSLPSVTSALLSIPTVDN